VEVAIFQAGDPVRRNSLKPGVGNIKGTVEKVKPNGSIIVKWGDSYRAHKSTVQAKSLTAWDAEIARQIMHKWNATRRHCGVHGNSVDATVKGEVDYCWQCGGTAAEVIDGNEHKRRQREKCTGREAI